MREKVEAIGRHWRLGRIPDHEEEQLRAEIARLCKEEPIIVGLLLGFEQQYRKQSRTGARAAAAAYEWSRVDKNTWFDLVCLYMVSDPKRMKGLTSPALYEIWDNLNDRFKYFDEAEDDGGEENAALGIV